MKKKQGKSQEKKRLVVRRVLSGGIYSEGAKMSKPENSSSSVNKRKIVGPVKEEETAPVFPLPIMISSLLI